VNSLLTQELAETDETKRAAIFKQLQDITAKDVPIIPSWNGKNTAVAASNMTGVQETLDPTYIFRMWTIGNS
jgi:peptide/nickel transport system substrate-binding protein